MNFDKYKGLFKFLDECLNEFFNDEEIQNIKNVNIGTDVYIWDNKLITLEDIAKKCNTINYEVLSTISSRVPRVFK